jgi:hypothetical protein
MTFENTAPVDPLERIRALQSPETRELLALMERVKSRYLRTGRDKDLAGLFQELLDELTLRADPNLPAGPGNRREGGVLVVTGESGAGKTTALKRLVSRHPAFPGYGVPRSGCAAVYVRVPSRCGYKALGRVTLRALGYPLASDPPAHIVWEKVYERIEELGKLVLHFDEMHNVTQTADADDIVDTRNMVKTMAVSPTWPVLLIISGLSEVVGLTQPITEIRRRCRYIDFASLSLPGDIAMMEVMAKNLSEVARLTLISTETEALLPRLIHAGLYQFGIAIELIQEAIGGALKSGAASLTRMHFGDAFARRTGIVASGNPFLAPDWANTDCTLVLNIPADEDPNPEDETPAERKARKKIGKSKRGRR